MTNFKWYNFIWILLILMSCDFLEEKNKKIEFRAKSYKIQDSGDFGITIMSVNNGVQFYIDKFIYFDTINNTFYCSIENNTDSGYFWVKIKGEQAEEIDSLKIKWSKLVKVNKTELLK
jgi:hypothetical protein